jgi:tetratricopeptide (TPR) repeat protein
MKHGKHIGIVLAAMVVCALLGACAGGGKADTSATSTSAAVPTATSLAPPTATATPAATPTPSADDHFSLGNQYYDQGQLQEAAAEFEQAIQLDPTHTGALLQLGIVYYDQARFEEAISILQQAGKLDPKNPAIPRNMGTAYGKLGQWDQASAAYEQAIALNPDFGEAYGDLVGAYAKLGKLAEAIAAGEKAIALAPDYATAYSNLGSVYGMQGDLDKAIALFQQALEIDPEDAMSHYNLGFAYEKQKLLDQAVFEYKRAIEIDPNYLDARESLGSVLAQQNQLDGAIAEWLALLEIAPQRASTYRLLGMAYAMQGQVEDALQAFNTYMKLAPDAPDRAAIANEIAKLEAASVGKANVYQNVAGGYGFPLPAGWYREEDGTLVKLSSSPSAMEDAPTAAPLILFQAGPMNELADRLKLTQIDDPAVCLQAMAASMNVQVANVKSGTLSNYPMAQADLSSPSPALQGAMVVVLVQGRGVSGIALSPPDQWTDLLPTFVSMLQGLSFDLPEYRSAAGGYSLRYPGSWSYKESGDTVTFALTKKAIAESEDAAFAEGLVMTFDASSLAQVAESLQIQDPSDPSAVAQAMAAALKAEVGGVETGKIGGYPAAYANISGSRQGGTYQGGLVAVLVQDRLIGAYVMTSPGLWGNVRPIFSSMLDSMSFFEP